MNRDVHVPVAPIFTLRRIAPSVAGLKDVEAAVRHSLSALQIPGEKLAGRRIAVTVGSRGIDRLPYLIRAVCSWLQSEGATAFLVPAMGSHGGGTAEGQRRVLEEYAVSPEFTGAEICSSMDTASLGLTAEGIEVFMDQNAYATRKQVRLVDRPCTYFTGHTFSSSTST